MRQLEHFADCWPSAWLEQGVFLTQVAQSAKKAVSAAVKNASGVAAITALAMTTNFAVPAATVAGWPLNAVEKKNREAIAEIERLGQRIDQKLARFQVHDPSIDVALISEAQLTLAAIGQRKA